MAEITLTQENFEQEVLQAKGPVLVDFWASWCGPCQALAPTIAELAEEYAGKVKVGKINVDEQRSLAAKYRVMSIPTLILFQDGEAKKTSVGALPKAQIVEMIS